MLKVQYCRISYTVTDHSTKTEWATQAIAQPCGLAFSEACQDQMLTSQSLRLTILAFPHWLAWPTDWKRVKSGRIKPYHVRIQKETMGEQMNLHTAHKPPWAGMILGFSFNWCRKVLSFFLLFFSLAHKPSHVLYYRRCGNQDVPMCLCWSWMAGHHNTALLFPSCRA